MPGLNLLPLRLLLLPSAAKEVTVENAERRRKKEEREIQHCPPIDREINLPSTEELRKQKKFLLFFVIAVI